MKQAGQKFSASRDAVSKRVQESISFAQDNGVKGYVQYAKDQASKFIENSLDLVQTGIWKHLNILFADPIFDPSSMVITLVLKRSFQANLQVFKVQVSHLLGNLYYFTPESSLHQNQH